MRTFKISIAVFLVLASSAITALTYLQSHGAGISTGILLLLVIVAYTYDHRHHIFGLEVPGSVRPRAQTVAMHQGRLTAMRQDVQS
jgi:apolipoprotein N-acyltransferase